LSRCLLICLAFVLIRPASAASPLAALEAGETTTVAMALDGETVRLADGREVRLAAIEAPPATHGGASVAEAAHTALAALTAGHAVALYYDERHNDRYGRLVAHLSVPPDLWVEAELVRQGLARVHTTADTATLAAPLLRIEAEARTAGRGLWALPAFRVHQASELRRWIDSFQVTTGRVVNVRRTSGGIWLDVDALDGAPSRNGRFVILIASTARKSFRAAGADPADSAGAAIRVRGWVRWLNGPLIEVDHPAQIEHLEGPRAARSRG
jgi:micrococcal nuclease